jgi:uncharacterized protein YndB with AHSA1/START domain
VSEVYRYAATPKGFTKWFIGEANFTSENGESRMADEFVSAGDKYQFKWLEKNFSVMGEVLQISENSFIQFTFGPSFTVTIIVKEDNGRTLLTLKQHYNSSASRDDFAHINCCVCWAFFITNLKSVIEYGNDLRETTSQNEELVNR